MAWFALAEDRQKAVARSSPDADLWSGGGGGALVLWEHTQRGARGASRRGPVIPESTDHMSC